MSIQKKKIGCVIACKKGHNNYGTSLQGYATLKKIESFGYDCEMILYVKHRSIFQFLHQLCVLIRIGDYNDFTRRIKAKVLRILNKGYKENINIRTHSVDLFKQKYLKPYFKVYNGFEELSEGSKNYDAVMVGSDQVWSLMSLYNKYYNLLFVDDNVPKFSYAPSFGITEIPDFQIKETKRYLDRIDMISVRELSGKKIVDSLSKKTAEVVCDPTLLLSKEEWENVISEKKEKFKEPYIFCYFLGRNEECRKAALDLQKKTKLPIVVARHMDEFIASDEDFGDYAPYDVDPFDFLMLIKNARYVLTDSFHGSVFSIIFQKQFCTFYRYKVAKGSRNSRIDSLFEILGVSERVFNGDICTIANIIDYSIVTERLNNFRQKSLDFLKKAVALAD